MGGRNDAGALLANGGIGCGAWQHVVKLLPGAPLPCPGTPALPVPLPAQVGLVLDVVLVTLIAPVARPGRKTTQAGAGGSGCWYLVFSGPQPHLASCGQQPQSAEHLAHAALAKLC